MKKKKNITEIVVTLLVVALLATVAIIKKDEISYLLNTVDYYEFINEKCGCELSPYLKFQEGKIHNKYSYQILYEVKDGKVTDLETVLDQNIKHKPEKQNDNAFFSKKKYNDLYENGTIRESYMFGGGGPGKSVVVVYVHIIEKDGKTYLFVYTW